MRLVDVLMKFDTITPILDAEAEVNKSGRKVIEAWSRKADVEFFQMVNPETGSGYRRRVTPISFYPRGNGNIKITAYENGQPVTLFSHNILSVKIK